MDSNKMSQSNGNTAGSGVRDSHDWDNWREGENVLLRPMTRADEALIIKWRNSDFVRKKFIYQKPFTVAGHREWVRTMLDSGKGVQFMICGKKVPGENIKSKLIAGEEPAGFEAVGSVYLRDINYDFRKAEYGIFIGEESGLGKGYGWEALVLLSDFAFSVLKLHKVSMRALSDNYASIKSGERAGYVREAYLKDEVKLDGVFRDIILMAKFCEENRE